MNTDLITKDTSLGDIVETLPRAAEILVRYGLLCVGCPYAGEHTLRGVKNDYGLSDEDIEEIVVKLNKLKEENENKQ